MISKIALVIVITFGVVAALEASPNRGTGTSRPNIIFFLTDDQPVRGMGHVDPWFHTPAIDRLAKEGVSFSNAFVESAVCAVSRASIMTGQFNCYHGIQSFDEPLSHQQLKQSFPVMLREAGYRTALLGKYAVGHPRSAPKELCLPAKYFDLWYGFSQSPSYKQKVDGKDRYLTAAMEDRAIQFMRDTPRDQPFLLYMCLPEPHGQGGPGGPWNYFDPKFKVSEPDAPLIIPETMNQEAYDRLPKGITTRTGGKNVTGPEYRGDQSYRDYMLTVRRYIARTDESIRRIRAAVQEMGLTDNTVILFFSDHGTMWGTHGIAGKWNMYEECIRAPFIMYDPRLPESERGSQREQMALNIDLPATIADLAGVPADHMQGQSVMPMMRDRSVKGRSDFYYLHDLYPGKKTLPRVEGVRNERWKYIHYIGSDPREEELFDLLKDPMEQNNLIADVEYEPTLNGLRKRMAELRDQLTPVAASTK